MFESLNDQERHNFILQTYVFNKVRKYKRDIDVIKEHHRFLWHEHKIAHSDSWEERLALRYYDKLFKEYCIADLSRYKENKIALRWRTESEVIAGKGQFQCGCRTCNNRENLRSWEVNFSYQEHGERKNALVKLRLCVDHSKELNYTSRKREIKRLHIVKKSNAKEKYIHCHETNEKIENIHLSSNNCEGLNGASISKPENIIENRRDGEMTHCEKSDENIWNKNLEIESKVSLRETDFEKYLEDLLV